LKKPKTLKQSFSEQFSKMNDATAPKNLSAAYQIRFGFTDNEKNAIR
jgi:hypothetical protein